MNAAAVGPTGAWPCVEQPPAESSVASGPASEPASGWADPLGAGTGEDALGEGDEPVGEGPGFAAATHRRALRMPPASRSSQSRLSHVPGVPPWSHALPAEASAHAVTSGESQLGAGGALSA